MFGVHFALFSVTLLAGGVNAAIELGTVVTIHDDSRFYVVRGQTEHGCSVSSIGDHVPTERYVLASTTDNLFSGYILPAEKAVNHISITPTGSKFPNSVLEQLNNLEAFHKYVIAHRVLFGRMHVLPHDLGEQVINACYQKKFDRALARWHEPINSEQAKQLRSLTEKAEAASQQLVSQHTLYHAKAVQAQQYMNTNVSVALQAHTAALVAGARFRQAYRNGLECFQQSLQER